MKRKKLLYEIYYLKYSYLRNLRNIYVFYLQLKLLKYACTATTSHRNWLLVDVYNAYFVSFREMQLAFAFAKLPQQKKKGSEVKKKVLEKVELDFSPDPEKSGISSSRAAPHPPTTTSVTPVQTAPIVLARFSSEVHF